MTLVATHKAFTPKRQESCRKIGEVLFVQQTQ